MHSRLRPSPAMVVALIALFVALSGTAAGLAGSDTVQSDDLGPGAQVAAADIQTGAVRSAQILDHSVKGMDIAANSVPASALTTNVGRVNDIRLGSAVDSDPRSLDVSDDLTMFTRCVTPGGIVEGKYVGFVNRSQATATLNWFFSNGSTVAANGVFLGPFNSGTQARTFDFSNRRIEGQFIFSTPGEMITVNLHAFDAGNRCEIHGTAQIKLG
jgi:hypothetical protein